MNRKGHIKHLVAIATGILLIAGNVFAEQAQPVPVHDESTVGDIKAALFGGVPNDRWKEGLLFEGIRPSPWMASASNWFPRTEEVQPNEMRIIFMGTSPSIRPGQANTSILVQLGNGENFVFDLGEGSPANYVAAGIALNEIKDVFITNCMLTTSVDCPMSGCLALGPVVGMIV